MQHFFETGDVKRLSVPNTARLSRILRALDSADAPTHMNLPGFRFHRLKGSERSRYAVDASGNWRVTFGWGVDGAVDVDLEDYH